MPTHETHQPGGPLARPRRTTPVVLVGLIGWLCALAQPASGQVRTPAVGAVGARSDAYTKRFRRLLLSVHKDLPTGWQLARDLGRPVAPVLWAMHGAESSNVNRRLVLLIAAVVAGGTAEDERLFALLDQPKPMLRERTMAAFLIALGPRRTRSVDDFWSRCIGPNTEPEPLLALAVRLACARFPDAKKTAPIAHGDDPGQLAAAAFAGLRLPPIQKHRLWRNPARYADLFYRGAFLGDGWRLATDGVGSNLLDLAESHAQSSDERLLPVRGAAMLLLARAGGLGRLPSRPDWRMLQLAASPGRNPATLRDWLRAAPLTRDEQPERLAVAYALNQPVSRVLAEHTDWSRDERIARHVAVALAFRLAAGTLQRPASRAANAPSNAPSGGPTPGSGSGATGAENPASAGALLPGPIQLRLDHIPEFRFAVWASGGPFEAGAACRDTHLEQLARLVPTGRASREVVRQELQQALWRWGSHPGIGPWQQERLLVRDLLLGGSNAGGGKYLPQLRKNQRYFPTGLDRGDGFFRVAVDLYGFLDAPAMPIPPEYRL